MADEAVIVYGVNWREAFPFTHLFRAFRVAIHPSKVVLALVALLLLYAGGRTLDAVWPVRDRAVPGEVAHYEIFQRQPHPGHTFSEYRDQIRGGIEADYAQRLTVYKVVSDQPSALKAARTGEYLSELKDAIK